MVVLVVIVSFVMCWFIGGAIVHYLIPEDYDWRLRARHIALRRSERELAEEVLRIVRQPGFSELTLLASSYGSIGLMARGTSRSPRFRTVQRRVCGACSYCVIENLVRGLPEEAFGGAQGGADRVVTEYREKLTSQLDAVRVRVFHGLDRSVTTGTARSNVSRYVPADCPVHSRIARLPEGCYRRAEEE
ncbi:hypothetical protein SAMN05428944_7646 [Streptomyces sp. 1222.5]|uniref:hypothetical protein n=1 Tax=unclassified Streptomyces TaxID=2593676 RepID=UPI000896787F|nr:MULTISPECIES: hypothetical protein [unclassified Streptomyces]PKW05337.1 hypothetical protein BX260_0441 [Streptomyces sp. 5112.2]SED42954.1 hypothetical protein SAMN05428944_7646 [Streptomyces sp. 1222.5]